MSEISDLKHRGFSYGVRHSLVTEAATLLDYVDRELAREHERLANSAEAGPATINLTALELIELGSVYVNEGRTLAVSLTLNAGDKVRIHTRPRRYPQPVDLLARVVSETTDVVVVDKPAGLPVHALVDNVKENLISYLEDLRGGTLYITHRLDVDTSGLVLLAKTAEAQARLNRAFSEGTVKRLYAAYVESPIAPGLYVHYMEPSPTAPKRVAAEDPGGWQRCELRVLTCEELNSPTQVISEGRTTWSTSQNEENLRRFYRLTISLQTGRPQQIRAQLSQLGWPIIGDQNYGSPFQLIDAESGRSAIALRAIDVLY